MFFYLSKILWFFVQPLNFSIFLILAALLAVMFSRRRLAVTSASVAFLILALSAWTSLGALLLNPLEERFQRPASLPKTIDGIVVLGGGLEGAINLARGGYELNSGGDRFVEAEALARRFPNARILVSGGIGTILLEGEGDADTAPRLLAALGVARDRLIVENKSRNTAENASLSKELINPQPGETWLLVTSAFHMPRSVGLFRKVDFPVVPWPTDYRTPGRQGFGFFKDNETDALQNTTVAIREWIGLFAYWLSGRIDFMLAGTRLNRRFGQHRGARGRKELATDQHGQQQQRCQREYAGIHEPAEIADRKEDAAQAGIEMFAGQNVHLGGAHDRSFRLRAVGCLVAGHRNCANQDRAVVEEPVGPAELEERIGEQDHQAEHLGFEEAPRRRGDIGQVGKY